MNTAAAVQTLEIDPYLAVDFPKWIGDVIVA